MRGQGRILLALVGAAVPFVAGTAGAHAATGPIDPEAMAALDRMGAFLRSQVTMSVQGETATDEVLPSDQKVQHVGVVELQVHRPDRMRADVTTDRGSRQIFYDGRTLTVFSRDVNYYAQSAAPPTVREVLDMGERRYGIDFPLVDLFTWGTEGRASDVTSATKLGQATIQGTPTDHYAFREGDVDWQVWIERGPHPLPRKMVITTRDAATQPQHAVVLTWRLSPQIDDRVFTFVPPPNAQRIPFQVMDVRGGAQ